MNLTLQTSWGGGASRRGFCIKLELCVPTITIVLSLLRML